MTWADRLRRSLVASIPPGPRTVLRELRALSFVQGIHYVRSFVTTRGRPVLPASLTTSSRIVFVCYGNIFRSPMAEALLIRELARRGVDAHRVSSAGLSARTGRNAHDNAIATAESMGVVLTAHRARLLTPEIVEESDLILVMDRMNVAIFADRFPAARARAVLLGAFDPDMPTLGPVITDPYGKSLDEVTACYRRLERSVVALAERLIASPQPPSA